MNRTILSVLALVSLVGSQNVFGDGNGKPLTMAERAAGWKKSASEKAAGFQKGVYERAESASQGVTDLLESRRNVNIPAKIAGFQKGVYEGAESASQGVTDLLESRKNLSKDARQANAEQAFREAVENVRYATTLADVDRSAKIAEERAVRAFGKGSDLLRSAQEMLTHAKLDARTNISRPKKY